MSHGTSRPKSKGKLVKNNHVDNDRTPLLNKDVQVQNVKSGTVYVFGDADVSEDEVGSHEMVELRPRGKARKQQREMEIIEEAEPLFIERTIAEGETLQGVAIKYGIQVAELKRINNLIKDQDFFGLQVIKVPMKRYGLLTELIDQEHKELPNGANLKLNGAGLETFQSLEANESEDGNETDDLLVRTLSIRDACMSSEGKDAASFLQRMDKDLKAIVESTKIQKGSLEEAVVSMTCKRIYPLQRQSSWLNGYDCGMRWWSVLLTFIVIGFIAPLVYFIYYEYFKKPGS